MKWTTEIEGMSVDIFTDDFEEWDDDRRIVYSYLATPIGTWRVKQNISRQCMEKTDFVNYLAEEVLWSFKNWKI